MTRSLMASFILLVIVCCGALLQHSDFFSLNTTNYSQASGHEQKWPAEKACSLEMSETHEHDVCSWAPILGTTTCSELPQSHVPNYQNVIKPAHLNIISPPPEHTL